MISEIQFNVIDTRLFPNSQDHPIVFEDIYIKNSKRIKYLDQN